MVEPRYTLIHPQGLPHPFIHVFEVHFDGPTPRFMSKEDFAQPVIEWLTERFGEGAVSTPGQPYYDLVCYAPGRDSVSYAWCMDSAGGVAFQAEDHAIEFRLRWCG